MFWKFFSKIKTNNDPEIVAKYVSQDLKIILDEFNQNFEFRLKEISAQIKEVELSVINLEKKLLTKDLKDKQALGHLHYKIEEKINNKN